MSDLVSKNLADIRRHIGVPSGVPLGIDLSTELLHDIHNSNKISIESISTCIKRLHEAGAIRVLLIAVNCFTFPVAMSIAAACRECQGSTPIRDKLQRGHGGIAIIASDVFRAHPRRPGLFVTEDLSMIPPPASAVAELRRAMDPCIKLEKKSISEVTVCE